MMMELIVDRLVSRSVTLIHIDHILIAEVLGTFLICPEVRDNHELRDNHEVHDNHEVRDLATLG